MAKIDMTQSIRAVDETLARDDLSPRQRQIMEVYRRHAILEQTGHWEGIFAPDMSVEEPEYRLSGSPGHLTLRGTQCHDFYRSLFEAGGAAFWVTDEKILVGDHGFHSAGWINNHYQGSHLIAQGVEVPDADAWYHVRLYAQMYWPFDEQARMIGEHYADYPQTFEVVGTVSAEDVVTMEQAQAELTPLLRPLPAYTP